MTKQMIIRAIEDTIANWDTYCKEQANYKDARDNLTVWLKELKSEV